MNLKINNNIGNDFNTVSAKAKEIAAFRNVVTEFEFNGCQCIVDKNTNLEFLFRDYMNHWTMNWETIGPNCVSEYSEEVKAELKKRLDIAEEKRKKQQAEYKKKEEEEKAIFLERTKGINLELLNKDAWELGKSNNTDDYGSCIYDYAEAWGKLMQLEMSNGAQLKDIAQKTSHELGFFGITGFMYGAAVQILSESWKHGEMLRNWHNNKYSHDGDGVVNPAVLTINS